MSELSIAVTELKRCGEILITIADSFKNLFSENADTEIQDQQKSEIPVPKEKIITFETVRAVLAEKSRTGYTNEIKELIKKHGAEKLSEIDPAEYPAMLSEAKVMQNG
jgi:hypothetical protein